MPASIVPAMAAMLTALVIVVEAPFDTTVAEETAAAIVVEELGEFGSRVLLVGTDSTGVIEGE